MRNPERIDRILEKIKILWKKYPDQRLGQLLFNYTRFGTRAEKLGTIKDIFFYGDDSIESDLTKALEHEV